MSCCKVTALGASDLLQQYKTAKRDEQEGSAQWFFPLMFTRCLGLRGYWALPVPGRQLSSGCGSDALLTCSQVATRPAAPAWARRPRNASDAGHQRRCCSLNSLQKEPCTDFASLTAKPGSTWMSQESANVSREGEQLFEVQGCAGFDVFVLTLYFVCL